MKKDMRIRKQVGGGMRPAGVITGGSFELRSPESCNPFNRYDHRQRQIDIVIKEKSGKVIASPGFSSF